MLRTKGSSVKSLRVSGFIACAITVLLAKPAAGQINQFGGCGDCGTYWGIPSYHFFVPSANCPWPQVYCCAYGAFICADLTPES